MNNRDHIHAPKPGTHEQLAGDYLAAKCVCGVEIRQRYFGMYVTDWYVPEHAKQRVAS